MTIRSGGFLIAGVATVLVVAAPTHAGQRSLVTGDTGREVAGDVEGALPIQALPLAIHRRVARYFEGMRQYSDSPWQGARLGAEVVPMARPGVDGVGYFEVPVVGPSGEPAGYILASSGRYDFPIAGSAKGGLPPSVQLAEIASARGKSIARIWMPSIFTFVAEDAAGEIVAQLGSLPPRVRGVDRSVLDLPAEARAGRDGSLPDVLRNIELSGWSSWRQYLGERGRPDAIDLEVMRRNALLFWEEEDDVTAGASELSPLRAEHVPLLDRGAATFTVLGPGARHVTAERERGIAGDEWVRLRATSAPDRDVATLTLRVDYRTGERELLGFAISPVLAQLRGPVFRRPSGARPQAIAVPTFPTCAQAAIRTERGNFLRAVDGGGAGLDSRADSVGPWEVFDLVPQGPGRVALRAHASGKFVRANNGGGSGVFVDRDAALGHEVFQTIASPDFTWAFRAANGQHLVAEGGGNGDVNADHATVGGWERFRVLCDPPPPQARFVWASSESQAWQRQRKYNQLDGNVAPNRAPCASGCGATVWAMLIGWGDYAASHGNPRFNGFRRLYVTGGGRGRQPPEVEAPERMDSGVSNMTVELRDTMGDWGASGCTTSGSRFTLPHIMAQANQYFWGRVPARVIADYDGAGIGTQAGADNVMGSLNDDHVTAIGIGYFSHYPAAFGYHRWTPRIWVDPGRWVDRGQATTTIEVNMGWNDSASRSVPLHSWFKGIVDPAPMARVQQIRRDCTLRAESGSMQAGQRMDRDYYCRTHLLPHERHVGFDVAEGVLLRDVMSQARRQGLKACLLNSTDIQCAPCGSTDRLIVRLQWAARAAACPGGTVEQIE